MGGEMKNHMPQMPQMGTGTKVALGVGAGMLLGGAFEHAVDDGDIQFNMSMPQMPQMPHLPNFGAPHHHAQQHHAQHHASGGLLGALAGGGAASMVGGGMGPGMGFPSGPKLHILSANYGGGDCTDAVRKLVKEDNCIHLDDNGDWSVFDQHFGDHWGGHNKSLCVLYQWEGRPLELAVIAQASGGVRIDHRDHVRPDRRAFICGHGPVIAVVWGIMENRFQPVPMQCIQEIAGYRNFKATNEYFGFDGWEGTAKTAVVFCRDGNRIYNFAVRDGNTGRL
jgi:hypothetical protein